MIVVVFVVTAVELVMTAALFGVLQQFILCLLFYMGEKFLGSLQFSWVHFGRARQVASFG